MTVFPRVNRPRCVCMGGGGGQQVQWGLHYNKLRIRKAPKTDRECSKLVCFCYCQLPSLDGKHTSLLRGKKCLMVRAPGACDRL